MLGLPDGIRGCLFDLDGVLTQTAKVHDAAWKQTFDDFLRARAGQAGQPFTPFDPVNDYDEYVDGKPRADGTRSFLASRGIELPEGSPDDPPDAPTVNGLGNRKNVLLLKMIRTSGVEAYEGSVRYVRAVRDAGLRRAVVSSSANCHDVLVAAGIEDLFEARIDGVVARAGSAARQARPGHLPGRGEGTRPGAAGRGGVRGRAGRRGGRPGRGVRLCRGGGPRRAGGRAEGPRRGHRRDRSRRAAGPSVIRQSAFTVEPWCLRETTLDQALLAQTESVFALSNGHLGWRGNLDEGEPHGLPGTYLNGVFALRPLPYAEAGYGFPESGQTVINVTNGKLIRLYVDDEPFDIRYGELRQHERVLDFRNGRAEAQRRMGLAGRAARSAISSTRLVSLTQRAIAAISYEVEPLDGPARISVQSELLANEQLPAHGGDPRVSAVLENPLACEYHADHGTSRRARAHDGTERAARRRGDGSPDRRLARHQTWRWSRRPTPTAAWSPRRRYCSRGSGCA